MKRCIALILSLLLLLGVTHSASANDAAVLDRALSRWLSAYPSVRFGATLTLKAHMPFPEETLAMFNAVLGHVNIAGSIQRTDEMDESTLQISVGERELLTLQEQSGENEAVMTLSLLPNRKLTTQGASPLDLLLETQATVDSEGTETAEQNEVDSAQDTKQGDTLNTSDVESAFSALDAIAQLREIYQTLTEKTLPLTEEKRANYNIKGIGAGKWSHVARLTAEQSESMLTPLRAVLACGMDEEYRDELSQVTFEKGFIVALYQNSDKKDICLYMKGNLIYPDGDKRKMVWEWAFKTDGLIRTDSYRFEVSRLRGTADSRTISASYTQESRSEAFNIKGKTETTLKRAKVTDKSVVNVAMAGKQSADLVLSAEGTLSRDVTQTISGNTTKRAENAELALAITPDGEGAILSGTATYRKLTEKTVESEVLLTFADNAPVIVPATAAMAPTITVIPSESSAISSLDLLEDAFTETGSDNDPQQDEYLVGTAPIGLSVYTVPSVETTIALDDATPAQINALIAEAAQNLAGKLLLAVAELPEEDAVLFGDGMTESDYAVFLSLLGI